MRLDARKGDVGWNVWHVPTCTQVLHTVWVDSDALAYAVLVRPIVLIDGEPSVIVHGASRIDILVHQRLVLIDPIDGEVSDETPTEIIAEIAG